MEQAQQNVVALSSGGRPLGIIPKSLQEVEALAEFMLASQYAPRDMDTKAKIVIGILHCLELGVSPMQGLAGIAVINGRPAIYGDMAWGLVLSSGLVEEHEEVLDGEGDRLVAVCRMRRKGRKDTVERRFSVADAKKARLWDERETVKKRSKYKQGETYEAPNDSPWFKYPGRMLMWRARHRCMSDLFADVTKGFPVWDRDEAKAVDAEFTEVPEPRAVELADLPTVEDIEAVQSGRQQSRWDAWLRSVGEDVLASPDADDAAAALSAALAEAGGHEAVPADYRERAVSLLDKRLRSLREAADLAEKPPEKPQEGHRAPEATPIAPEGSEAASGAPEGAEAPSFLSFEDAQALLHKQRTVEDVKRTYEGLKAQGFSADALDALHKYANKRARLLKQVAGKP